jgi:predicted nucleotidyltransferase
MQISEEELKQYQRAAYARWQAEQRQQEERRAQAWSLAHEAAQLLKQEYAATRVVVFGSLTHLGRFTARSDVDLAVWGLTTSNWLRAIGAVRELSREIDLNVADVECCAPALIQAIERDGVPV